VHYDLAYAYEADIRCARCLRSWRRPDRSLPAIRSHYSSAPAGDLSQLPEGLAADGGVDAHLRADGRAVEGVSVQLGLDFGDGNKRRKRSENQALRWQNLSVIFTHLDLFFNDVFHNQIITLHRVNFGRESRSKLDNASDNSIFEV